MRIIKILVILLAIFSTQIGITNAMSIMPTNEIQAGMVGVAKTVIKRSAIEEFSVEIVGVLNESPKEEGYIFSISSICATSANPHGACYGATKAGLANFNRSFFEESRKSHLKVVTIAADMTDTNLYRNADFGIGTDKLSYLTPEEVADTIKYALSLREGAVMSEILLRPQLHSITRKK